MRRRVALDARRLTDGGCATSQWHGVMEKRSRGWLGNRICNVIAYCLLESSIQQMKAGQDDDLFTYPHDHCIWYGIFRPPLYGIATRLGKIVALAGLRRPLLTLGLQHHAFASSPEILCVVRIRAWPTPQAPSTRGFWIFLFEYDEEYQ